MVLRNVSKKTILASDIKRARSLADKTLGLLKKTNPRSMIFETRFGIHTFFMVGSIDVLVLDSKYRVRQIKKSLKPNKIFIYWPKFPFVVELPEGITEKSKTETGDVLKIDF